MTDDDDALLERIDIDGLCTCPPNDYEVDPQLHDRFGLNHDGGPAPVIPVPR